MSFLINGKEYDLDSVEQLAEDVAKLTKERDEFAEAARSRSIEISNLSTERNRLRVERDQLAAKCAEMRDILTDIEMCNEEYERVCPGCHEPIMDADENILETEHSPTCRFVHALSDQCGVGWLSPQKKRVLVEALERCMSRLDGTHHNQTLKQAKEALEMCK